MYDLNGFGVSITPDGQKMAHETRLGSGILITRVSRLGKRHEKGRFDYENIIDHSFA